MGRLSPPPRSKTSGTVSGDQNYDTAEVVAGCRKQAARRMSHKRYQPPLSDRRAHDAPRRLIEADGYADYVTEPALGTHRVMMVWVCPLQKCRRREVSSS